MADRRFGEDIAEDTRGAIAIAQAVLWSNERPHGLDMTLRTVATVADTTWPSDRASQTLLDSTMALAFLTLGFAARVVELEGAEVTPQAVGELLAKFAQQQDRGAS